MIASFPTLNYQLCYPKKTMKYATEGKKNETEILYLIITFKYIPIN